MGMGLLTIVIGSYPTGVVCEVLVGQLPVVC